MAVLAVALATVLLTVPEDDSAYAFGKLRGTPGAGGSFVDAVPAGSRVSLEVTGLPPRADYDSGASAPTAAG